MKISDPKTTTVNIMTETGLAQRLDSLLSAKSGLVSAEAEGSTLRVHAKNFRIVDGDRCIVIDYRAEATSPLREELDAAYELLAAIAAEARSTAESHFASMRLELTAERNSGTVATFTDVIYTGALRDFSIP